MQFYNENGRLKVQKNGEKLLLEPWGKDSLRVRAVMQPEFSDERWALVETPESTESEVKIYQVDSIGFNGLPCKREVASIQNGRIRAEVNFAGVITFFRDDTEILREYFRSYDGTISRESRCLKVVNREWKGILGGSEYTLDVKFEARDEEKIFGMGQYQQKYMDLKGCVL